MKREDIINKMAAAIRKEDEKREKDWDDIIAIRTSRRESKRYAEAALDAFLGQLGEGVEHSEPSIAHINNDIVTISSTVDYKRELYQEILDLKKG